VTKLDLVQMMNGNVELARMLLDAGADVNSPPAADDGRTALNLSRDRVSSLRKGLASQSGERYCVRVIATGKNGNT
jgi:hypothetical protein